MTELDRLNQRIRTMERTIRRLTMGIVGVALVLLTGAAWPSTDLIRTKGLIITDDAGRERIVIGATMAAVTEDSRLAGVSGMSILDSAGQMSISLGTNNPLILPDGSAGTRIGTENGLIIYDPRNGQERGGIGAFIDGRANVCLDYASASKEAACMTVASGDEYTAVLLNGTPGEEEFDRVAMFVGADGTGVVKAMGSGAQKGGVVIKSGLESAEVLIIDSTLNVVRDLTGP